MGYIYIYSTRDWKMGKTITETGIDIRKIQGDLLTMDQETLNFSLGAFARKVKICMRHSNFYIIVL